MPWIYSQSTGRLTNPAGEVVCAGSTRRHKSAFAARIAAGEVVCAGSTRLCYSGGGGRDSQNQPKYPDSVNNSQHENLAGRGPIPRGQYKMIRLEANGGTYTNASGHSLGPYVIALEPVGHSALGRSGFKVHGDNAFQNFSASEGCIIATREDRKRMWEGTDHLIDVVF